MDIEELRQLGLEQLNLTLKDTAENLFRLKLQSQSERLNAPSELKRNRRLIARVRTLIRERELAAEAAAKSN
jgi:large subunit ribosomal protein L29